MKITMYLDNILLKPEPVKEKTDSGLHIPPSARGNVRYGEVVAAGPGVWSATGELIPTVVQVGKRVAHFLNKGVEQELDGTKYLILKESDILFATG